MTGVNGGTFLVIVLILLSGFIAYLGDQIGMKLGKKRISLFGLRPRYSSIIITIITGMLIAVISLGLLLTTYSGLRQALFHIDEILEEKDEDLQQMQEEILQREDELNVLESERDELKQEKQDLENELKLTREEFEETRVKLESARSDIDDLEENREELEYRVSELTEQREKLEEQIAELDLKLEEVIEDYELAQEVASRYMAGYYSYRDEDIVYQKGEVIYSDVLEGGKSEVETIDDLYEFLSEADRMARTRPIQVNEQTGKALQLEENEIHNMARILLNMEEGKRTIVSLVANVNVSRHDWLWASFMYNEDFVVYEKGDKIISIEIDTDRSAEKIEEKLNELLHSVNEQAVNEGLLPDTRGRVGSIDFSQFYELLSRIETMSGNVRLIVYAQEDIWRSDRLSSNLDFEIIRLNGSEK